jgi:hypothetical protein
MAIPSKMKGKSGGARVITYLISEDQEVYLVHIYDKGQLDNLGFYGTGQSSGTFRTYAVDVCTQGWVPGFILNLYMSVL